jgi:hypothetical protein
MGFTKPINRQIASKIPFRNTLRESLRNPRNTKENEIMKTILKFLYPIFALCAFVSFALAQEESDSISIGVITTFDYPGTRNLTRPQKINDAGDIVGSYEDSNGVTRGFIRFANGNFAAPIVAPNDTGNLTIASCINNSRLIGGLYDLSDDTFHGYFFSNGNFSEFDVPGSTDTEVLGVNNAGDFSGAFYDAAGDQHGFISVGGTVTPFDVPRAVFTTAYQLNSSNQLVGYYLDNLGRLHGFGREANGAVHFPIDPSGSVYTELFGNNDSNWIVGRYMDSIGITHALLLILPNRFITFDYPGSTFTSFNGINALGFICGRYADASGIEHGIIARVRGIPPVSKTGEE